MEMLRVEILSLGLEIRRYRLCSRSRIGLRGMYRACRGLGDLGSALGGAL